MLINQLLLQSTGTLTKNSKTIQKMEENIFWIYGRKQNSDEIIIQHDLTDILL